MTKPLTVAIIYGFSEGKYHSRKLREALLQAGYLVTSNITSADIIIAHSAGCYLVPVNHTAKVVLNIGYTFWPGRKLLDSLRAKLAEEYRRTRLLRWLKECAIHDFYALNLPHLRRLLRGWGDPGSYLKVLRGTNIFVRNRDDPYCEPRAVLGAAGTDHTYISMPGYHDHLWDEPETYVNLLKSLV